MPSARKEIANILSEVEKGGAMPSGILKKIYRMESGVVHLRSRERIYSSLREIISDAAEDSKGA